MSADAVADLLRERLGLDPDTLGAGVIPAAVRTRMAALSVTDPAAYAQQARAAAQEYQRLVDTIVVPESWFFRGGTLFTHLADHVSRAAQARGAPVRVLCVPCAAGQEPYSLALALQEHNVPATAYHIEGVDVSPRLVEQARAGIYGPFSFREVEPALQRRLFRPAANDQWQLLPAVRSRVCFRVGNAIDPHLLFGEPPFDLIFCRNLLIYLHPAARRQVLDNLDRLLAPDGLLCIGHAEPLAQYDARFAATGPREFFLYRRAGVAERPESAVPASGGRQRLETGHTLEPECARPSPSASEGPRADARARIGPSTAESPVEPADARQLADAGRLDEALRLCRAQLDSGAPTAALYSLLGVIHQARHEDADAEAAFRKALYLEPEHSEALLHLSLLHQQRGDTAQADRLRQRLRRSAGGDS